MKTKDKLLAVLILSLVIFIGGGLLLLNQYEVIGNRSVISSVINSLLPEQQIDDKVIPLNSKQESSYTGNYRSGSNRGYTADAPKLIKLDSRPTSLIHTGGTSYNPKNYEQKRATSSQSINTYSTPQINMIASGGATNRGTFSGSANSSYGSGDNFGGYGGGIMSVPFSHIDGTDDRALIDPGPTVNNEDNKVLPVGGGLYFLLLLALGYGVVLRVKR